MRLVGQFWTADTSRVAYGVWRMAYGAYDTSPRGFYYPLRGFSATLSLGWPLFLHSGPTGARRGAGASMYFVLCLLARSGLSLALVVPSERPWACALDGLVITPTRPQGWR